MGKTCWMVRLGHPEVGPLSCGQVWHRFIFESVASPFLLVDFPCVLQGKSPRTFFWRQGKLLDDPFRSSRNFPRCGWQWHGLQAPHPPVFEETPAIQGRGWLSAPVFWACCWAVAQQDSSSCWSCARAAWRRPRDHTHPRRAGR